MTVPSATSDVTYDGNGSTQIFSVPFYFLDDTHLVVQTVTAGVASTKTLNTDYTVSGAGNEAGGDVTFLSAPATGTKVHIYRQVPLTQLASYVENTPFPATTQERALDQLTMADQQLYLAIQGALRLSTAATVDGVSAVLPDPLAGSLLGWNATGTALANLGASGVGAGSILDVNVAANAAIQASKLSYLRSEAGAVQRTVAAKLGEYISITDFGAVGDGVTDDTAAVNACIAACAANGKVCFVPATTASYRLTSTITLGDYKLSIIGEGCGMLGFPSAGRNLGPGSWFLIDHTGVGFLTSGTTTYPKYLRGIGTIRNQPTPNGGAYTPTANDYDFHFAAGAGDGYFDDVCLLNPTKGIKVEGGRIAINRMRGQPLTEGVNLYSTGDTAHIHDVHFWPFWSLDTGVTNYVLASGKAFVLGNADNPQLSDIFTIHYNRSISCENLGGGPPVKVKLSNFDFDNGGVGFYIDAGCTGTTALLTHGYILGASSAPTGCHNIDVSGPSSRVQIDNVECDLPDSSCLSVTGSGSAVYTGNFGIGRWGHGTAAACGIAAGSGTTIALSAKPAITGAAAGTGAMFNSGTGLTCPLGSGFATLSLDASGNANVTHGAGVTPRIVQVTPDATAGAYIPFVTAIGATTFTVNAYPVGSATKATGHGLTLHWRCAY